jgi:hypothetical protein
MIVLEKAVYENNSIDGVNQILGFNQIDGFAVMTLKTGKQKTQKDALNCKNLSFDSSDFTSNNDECIKYVIDLGIKHLIEVPEKYQNLLYDREKDLADLIDKLKKIDSGELEVSVMTDSSDGWTYINTDNEIGMELESLACSCLIETGGKCDWSNIAKVRKEGFNVFAGESDSFGWLTGCIRTSKGVIVYG